MSNLKTEHYYKVTLQRNDLQCVVTDGVKYLIDQVGGYWLIDEVYNLLATKVNYKEEWFTAIKLVVNGDKMTMDIIVEDGNYNKLAKKHISFTDWPDGTWEMFASITELQGKPTWVIMLTSEY